MSLPTPAEIDAAQTPSGGWDRETLAKWGVAWPPPKGWKRSLLRHAPMPRGTDHPIERTCPRCGAHPGQACQGGRGDRKAFHRDRGGRKRSHHFAPVADLETESVIEERLAGSIRGWIEHHEIADATIETQVPIGPYRADILISSAGRRLVVECDGVTYHSSREAVAHDKKRDRYCAVQGIAVMRFTGPEILKDVRGCAAQVGLWIRAQR